ncbi:hypothetical protein Hypma_006061 [Hypsizygus marmoreus]|uniref:Uncharacterized protein n=1 Tax=Hypsizygus marmoreus TaxID=39966 RepID=A0A369K3K1_HYPMA|nr:hypothetical protein Hypma_006061 [Hypsizygus marmoreus]
MARESDTDAELNTGNSTLNRIFSSSSVRLSVPAGCALLHLDAKHTLSDIEALQTPPCDLVWMMRSSRLAKGWVKVLWFKPRPERKTDPRSPPLARCYASLITDLHPVHPTEKLPPRNVPDPQRAAPATNRLRRRRNDHQNP